MVLGSMWFWGVSRCFLLVLSASGVVLGGFVRNSDSTLKHSGSDQKMVHKLLFIKSSECIQLLETGSYMSSGVQCSRTFTFPESSFLRAIT